MLGKTLIALTAATFLTVGCAEIAQASQGSTMAAEHTSNPYKANRMMHRQMYHHRMHRHHRMYRHHMMHHRAM